MRQIESTGKRQWTFISERLVERKKPLAEPITRNKLSFFATQQLSSMKWDCFLFSRLYISCQTRYGDLGEFFKHESQSSPPSLSDQGNLRLPKKKSELTECLQVLTGPQSQMPRDVNVVIIDGAAVVNMVIPGTERTFSGYAAGSFIPYITAQLCHLNRLDIVWDEYLENSLKAPSKSWFWCATTTTFSGRQQTSKKLERIPTSRPEQAGIVQVPRWVRNIDWCWEASNLYLWQAGLEHYTHSM